MLMTRWKGTYIPLYASARKKKRNGRKVCEETGLRRDRDSKVERENKQSRISCPIEAHNLSPI